MGRAQTAAHSSLRELCRVYVEHIIHITAASFFSVSKEEVSGNINVGNVHTEPCIYQNVTEGHTIVPDGYNIGR